jgi:hypothetical protein
VVWLVAGAGVLWVCGLVAAPLLPVPAAAVVYALGSFICHQRPERSFELAGAQLPVCARCLGLYAGAACGAVLASGVALRRGSPAIAGEQMRRWRTVVLRRGRTLVALSVIPALLSLVVEWTGIGQPGNAVRAFTGVVAGSIVAAVVLATLHYERCAPPQPIAPNRPPTPT